MSSVLIVGGGRIGAYIGSLLADLNRSGIAVRDLSTHQSSLEDIFVNLVREQA